MTRLVNSSRIACLSFDVMNTIIKLKESPLKTYSKFAADYGFTLEDGVDAKRFSYAFQLVSRGNPCYGFWREGPDEWWKELFRIYFGEKIAEDEKFDQMAADLIEYYATLDAWELTDGRIANLLQSCQQNGIQAAIVSNFDVRLRRLLDSLDLSKYFKTVLLSGEVGLEKPDAAIFKKLLQIEKILDPSECVHIGDDVVNDFEAPRQCGMKAYLLRTAKPNQTVPNEYIIDSLADLDKQLVQTK